MFTLHKVKYEHGEHIGRIYVYSRIQHVQKDFRIPSVNVNRPTMYTWEHNFPTKYILLA